ncbi:hypothetical protein L226DRAFT_526445 [Lentinus tigrinus ALCF2SS1-7]|uniref:uncharacterized protein n=1 Tax=Lentinus tigrinus ALCF2SS1-7 TaxID=1328758 RepID=UPI0011662181|nr:hypothetical protein L226DRAFT_526445 [Lentinus tigrinus ALCF2SS1-7]
MVTTRSDNSNKHYGKFDLPKPRRTGAQVQAEQKAKTKAQRKKIDAEAKKQVKVAQMEQELTKADDEERSRRVKRARTSGARARTTSVCDDDGEDEDEEELPRKKGNRTLKSKPVGVPEPEDVSMAEEDPERATPGPTNNLNDNSDGRTTDTELVSPLTDIDTPIAPSKKSKAGLGLRAGVGAAKAGLDSPTVKSRSRGNQQSSAPSSVHTSSTSQKLVTRTLDIPATPWTGPPPPTPGVRKTQAPVANDSSLSDMDDESSEAVPLATSQPAPRLKKRASRVVDSLINDFDGSGSEEDAMDAGSGFVKASLKLTADSDDEQHALPAKTKVLPRPVGKKAAKASGKNKVDDSEKVSDVDDAEKVDDSEPRQKPATKAKAKAKAKVDDSEPQPRPATKVKAKAKVDDSEPRQQPATKAKAKAKVDDSEPHPRPTAKKTKRKVVVDDCEFDTDYSGNGYVETDDEAEEANAAKTSPAKHGQRKTSAALVKLEPMEPPAGNGGRRVSNQSGAHDKFETKEPGRRNTSGSGIKLEPAEALAFSKERKPAREHKRPPSSVRTATSSGRPAKDGTSKGKAIDITSDDEAPVKSSRATYKNSDLPPGAHDENLWKEELLPTFLRYFGSLKDPWNVLQHIWDVVYEGRLEYTITTGDKVHGLLMFHLWQAMQRVYEWRGSFGSNALRAFDSWFRTKGDQYAEPRKKAAFCKKIIPDGRLFYEDPEGRERIGLYRSPFVLAAFAGHLDATRGAVIIKSLYSDRQRESPYGALGLAGAAVYRAAVLYAAEKVVGTGRNITIIKGINHVTGKESKDTDFSMGNFSEKTKECALSASSLSDTKIRQIWVHAKSLVFDTPITTMQSAAKESNYSKLVDDEVDE